MNPTLSLWSPPPKNLALADRQVHFWRFRLDLPASKLSELTQLLSKDEKARAERLLDRSKASSFIAARGRTRQILSRYLKRKPAELTFSYGEQGKPCLTDTSGQNLEFNISHAGNWGVIAIFSGGKVGVDIEQIDRQLDSAQIAENFFSPVEIDRLAAYPPARRQRGFYRIWTRKEAFLKGEGFGFSSPRIINHNNEWLIRSFSIARHYLGAVAVSEEITNVQRWDLV